MAGLAEALNQPVEFEIDGVKYRLSRLTLGDWAELERWAEGWIFEDLGRRLKQLPPESEEAKVLRQKIVNLSGEELDKVRAEFLKTHGNAAYVKEVFYALRRNHPEITESKAGEIANHPALYEAQARLYPKREGDAARPTQGG